MAPVARELVLLPRDQQRTTRGDGGTPAASPWIDDLPADFRGRVTLLPPDYRVEVSRMIDDDGGGGGRSTLDRPTLLSLDNGVRLQARDDDYVCVTHHQCRLRELIAMPPTHLQRIVRVVDWDEVSRVRQ